MRKWPCRARARAYTLIHLHTEETQPDQLRTEGLFLCCLFVGFFFVVPFVPAVLPSRYIPIPCRSDIRRVRPASLTNSKVVINV